LLLNEFRIEKHIYLSRGDLVFVLVVYIDTNPNNMQRFVLSTFSFSGIQGNYNYNVFSSPWLLILGPLIMCQSSTSHLHNVKTYSSAQSIQVANIKIFNTTIVGGLTPSFQEVFTFPNMV